MNQADLSPGRDATRGSRRALALLLVVAALSFSLAGLWLEGPDYDEAISQLVVAGHGDPQWPGEPESAESLRQMFHDTIGPVDLFREVRDTEVHPPVHSFALWLVHGLVGPGIVAARLLSFLACVGVLICLGRVWRRDGDSGILATAVFWAILATAAGFYAQSTFGRGYALATFFLCAGYAGVRRLADTTDSPADSRKDQVFAAGVGLACGLAPLTHYLTGFVAGTIALAGMMVLFRSRRRMAAGMLGAAALLPVILAAYFFVAQIGRAPDNWAEYAGPGNLVGRLLSYLLFLGPPDMPASNPGVLALMLGGILALIAISGAILRCVKADRQFWIVIFPAILLGIHLCGLVGLSLFLDRNMDSQRYVMLVWPFAAMVQAAGVLWLARYGRSGIALRVLWPGLLIATQAGVLAAFLAAGTGGQWQPIAAAASPGNALLIVDRGYGRGTPGAIILAADPGTRLWIVDLDRLRLEKPGIAAEQYEELHVALSNRTVAKDGPVLIELVAFPIFRRYSEKPGNIPYYRHFVRNAPD